MGQQALELEWKKVLKATSKFNRSRIDKYTQIYLVSLTEVTLEVNKALRVLLPPQVEIPVIVNKHCSDYCRQLYVRYKAITKASRTKKIQYTVEGTSTNFVVIASSIGNTMSSRAQVLRELNSVRTNKSGGVIASSLKQLNIKDLNADKSPLGLLRFNILKSVFDINSDMIDLSQDSKILDIIMGARHKDKRTGIFSAKRETGLLHFGHLEGFAIVEQRAAEIISRVKKKTDIEIGTASLEKYLNEKARIGDILGGFNVTISLKEVAAGKDEFNLNNISKQEEGQLIRNLKQEFLINGQKWAKQRGSSSIQDKGEEVIVYRVGNVVDTTFSNIKNSKVVYKPAKVKRPKKEPPTKTKPLPIIREVTEYIETSKSSLPDSKKASSKVKSPQAKNWLSLVNIINKKLPQQVASNMGAPGLVYRTGRLADSSKIVNIETTKEGYPSIIFDYQRDPYNVFDRAKGASPWNTPARDPRALVDKSVREIVQEMAIGRFYTRRA